MNRLLVLASAVLLLMVPLVVLLQRRIRIVAERYTPAPRSASPARGLLMFLLPLPVLLAAVGALMHGDLTGLSDNGICYGPVSYTHLDVYKRQILDLARLRRCFQLVGGDAANPLNIARHQDRLFHGFRGYRVPGQLDLAVFEFDIEILDAGIGRLDFLFDFGGGIVVVSAEQLFTLVDEKIKKSHSNLL